MSPNAFWILFILGFMIMIFIMFLIVLIASETKHGKIIVGLNQDHICEQCGEIIPIEHPCNCQKCWNDAISKSVKLTSRMDRLKDQIESLAREMETDQPGNKLEYWVISLRKINADARPLPSKCRHEDLVVFDEDDGLCKVCLRCSRIERKTK